MYAKKKQTKTRLKMTQSKYHTLYMQIKHEFQKLDFSRGPDCNFSYCYTKSKFLKGSGLHLCLYYLVPFLFFLYIRFDTFFDILYIFLFVL